MRGRARFVFAFVCGIATELESLAVHAIDHFFQFVDQLGLSGIATGL